MNIYLTHGYHLQDDAKEKRIMRPYVPLGILYISSYLKSKGETVRVFDGTFSDSDTQFDDIVACRPQVLGIYVNLMTKLAVIRLLKRLSSLSLRKEMRIVLGGPDLRYNQAEYLQAGADFLVIGEGEVTFHELVAVLKSPEGKWSEVPGLAYLQDGVPLQTATRQHLKAVDELPFPDRDSAPIEQYLTVWKKHHGQSTLSVSTQRGCPYTCKWCSTAVYGQSYRRRSPASVVAELDALNKRYGPDSYWFVDDVFTVSHRWLELFQEELIKQGVTIRYECITRADRLSDAALDLLRSTGCIRVWIGAESGSQRILDAMDRRVEATQVQAMIRGAQARGMEAGTFIMLGYPGEERSDIEETLNHLKAAVPTYFTITLAYPIRGTRLDLETRGDQHQPGAWETITDRDRQLKRPFPTWYYKMAIRRIVHEVRLHQLDALGSLTLSKRFKHWTKARISLLAMDAHDWLKK